MARDSNESYLSHCSAARSLDPPHVLPQSPPCFFGKTKRLSVSLEVTSPSPKIIPASQIRGDPSPCENIFSSLSVFSPAHLTKPHDLFPIGSLVPLDRGSQLTCAAVRSLERCHDRPDPSREHQPTVVVPGFTACAWSAERRANQWSHRCLRSHPSANCCGDQ